MGSFCKIRRSKCAIQFIRHKLHIVFKLLNCHYLPYAYRDSVLFFAVPADSFFGTNPLLLRLILLHIHQYQFNRQLWVMQILFDFIQLRKSIVDRVVAR